MIVARERKGLKIQGARRVDRRRHTRWYVERRQRVHPEDSAPYVAAADCGEKSGLTRKTGCPDTSLLFSVRPGRNAGKGMIRRKDQAECESPGR